MRLIAAFALLLLAVAVAPAAHAADDADLRAAITQLKEGSFNDRGEAIKALAGLGDPRAARALTALGGGDLYQVKKDGSVVIADRNDDGYKLSDPITGAALGQVGRRDVKKIKVNNNLRGIIKTAVGALTLRADDPAQRRKAALAILNSRDAAAIPLLDAAIAAEKDDGVRTVMQQARAAAVLDSDRSDADKLSAVEVLQARGDADARSLLLNAAHKSEGAVKAAAMKAAAKIEQTLKLWSVGQNVWYGFSLGSVLLLAAIGLAITFGVMGVINMAHGEMVMLGAYTTYVVQEVIRAHAPGLFDVSLFIAVPLAFVVAGGAGVGIERGVIRFLYGRPLETLLATWGISLVLQQAVRSIFGPTNKDVGTPDFMSGAFQVGQMTITYNRLYIIVFAAIVLFGLMLLIRKSAFGLQMRAVVQNRGMAGAMGIRTPWVDALTFGLGSGIAGIAGVALSQIDNVSPNLGQSYIIDSFMVVVFGGVGNLWGTLVAAMTLGIANKFLEPYAGAVLGKIFVLVFIILFIQKRPRGLFALRGRAVEQ